jgi:hypothetical protein
MENKEKISANPIHYLCSAIKNLVSTANGNEKPSLWERLSLDQLVSCFTGINKEKFLTDKPLISTLLVFRDSPGDLRDSIPNGTRITLVANRCDDNGLELLPKHLNDDANTSYPYFRLLYSNPKDPHGNALGLGNLRPAPLLPLYPEEILLQGAFVVNYDNHDPIDLALIPQAALPTRPVAEDDQNMNDYLYLASEISGKYARLQELIRGRMK